MFLGRSSIKKSCNYSLLAGYSGPMSKADIYITTSPNGSYREKLVSLLSKDLDFIGLKSGYASHNFHSFPAKFPPQLPREFILGLTEPGEAVLDPMVGSGTTILESYLTGRYGIGFDIDPLALMISKMKVTPFNKEKLSRCGYSVLDNAIKAYNERRGELFGLIIDRFDSHTLKFINYWFASKTQIELMALILEIERIPNEQIKTFLMLVFSAIVITKSGGVSLALDLAHTRPHRAKIVLSKDDEVMLGSDLIDSTAPRLKILTKRLRSTFEEFEKKLKQNIKGVLKSDLQKIPPSVEFENAQSLPLDESTVDLIVTSPPYASNAIDYMRAHKFSLIWMGYPVTKLSERRRDYLGGESVSSFKFEKLPDYSYKVVNDISILDKKRGFVLHRYYSEMKRTLQEMFRVLKPGKAAIVVVGSSIMRGKDTETASCLKEIGEMIGFEVPKIGVRNIDRNRRMLPAGTNINHDSQIQQRMHQEFIIGFYKPEI